MRKYKYVITLNNGVQHNVIGTSKAMVKHELSLLGLPVVSIDRVYKTGKRAECPW